MFDLDFDKILRDPIYDVFGKYAFYKSKAQVSQVKKIIVIDKSKIEIESDGSNSIERFVPVLALKREDVASNPIGDFITYNDKEYVIEATITDLLDGQKTGEIEVSLKRKRS